MNFTVADILGVSVGFVCFGLFAFAPGYTFGWLSDIFKFRRRRLATRITAAVPLSIGLMPITAYLLWHLWLPLVWGVFGACGVACVLLLIYDWRILGLHLSRQGWTVAAIAVGWLVMGTLSLIDLQLGHRLYFPFSDLDHSTRTAFTAAIARDGIPPHNPFFFAGQPAPLHYHYFWLIPSALVDRLGGSLVTARLGVIDGTLWAGLGLMGVIALYLRFFQSRGGAQIERRTLIAVSLLGITGLDILPVLLLDLGTHSVLPTIEAWNNKFYAWISALLWVPHDLASLTAGLTGFLLAWEAARENRNLQRIAACTAAGLAFASSAGSSIFVSGTVAVGCALWFVIATTKGWRRHALLLAAAGILAIMLLLPWIIQILHAAHPGAAREAGTSSFPFSFGVRSFIIPDAMAGNIGPAKLMVLNAALLPLNYFLELGFFLVVANLKLRQLRKQGFLNQTEWGTMALALASLLVCTFVNSTVISENDLAWRSPLVLQFLLLVLAAEMWNEGKIGFGIRRSLSANPGRRAEPALVTVTLLLGAMGSCYELGIQRAYPILSDSLTKRTFAAWISPDRELGRRTFALRSAYEELDRKLPARAVVQANPGSGIGDIVAELYSGRQMVADVGNCGTVFGGSESLCRDAILPQLKPLFDDRNPVTMKHVEEVCREFSMSALLFKDTDPAWRDKSSWIWHIPPLIGNRYARVIQCDGAADESNR
jgi:hypothetical protein